MKRYMERDTNINDKLEKQRMNVLKQQDYQVKTTQNKTPAEIVQDNRKLAKALMDPKYIPDMISTLKKSDKNISARNQILMDTQHLISGMLSNLKSDQKTQTDEAVWNVTDLKYTYFEYQDSSGR